MTYILIITGLVPLVALDNTKFEEQSGIDSAQAISTYNDKTFASFWSHELSI